MSRAEVDCPYCDKEWTYSGLSSSTCYCPRCSGQVRLDSPNADVIKTFGPSDPDFSTNRSGNSGLVEPIHVTKEDDDTEDYIEDTGEDIDPLMDFDL